MAGDPDTVIRAAEPSDAEALGRLSQRTWELTYRGIVPDPVLDEWIATVPQQWRDTLTAAGPPGAARRWVGERGGVLLGYATTAPGESTWLPPPDGAGELTNLYVDPDAIGTGLGRSLYEHAVADLRERDFAPFVVWAFRHNERATRFYLARGLRLDAEHDWVLGEIPCPIVRFRGDWPADARR